MKKMILSGIVVFGFIIIGLVLYAVHEMGAAPTPEELKSFEKLPYFKNGQFRNPGPVRPPAAGEYEDKVNLLNLVFSKSHGPKKPTAMRRLTASSFPETPENSAVYWLGHSAGILELNGQRIGVDLVFDNASPVPLTVKRYQPAPIARGELPKLDYILLTHNHYDHLERKTVRSIRNGHFIVPYGLKTALTRWGIAADRITEIGWRDTFEQDGLKITAVEGIHFSGRSLSDANQTLWNSYIIETPDQKIFWGGDSGYGRHYAEIGRQFGPFDWAALEIDAWNGGWPGIHMFPDQTVQAAVDLKAKRLLPIHWGVYDLAWHDWQKSINRVVDEIRDKPIELMTPEMGEKLIPGKTKTAFWWRETD